MCNYDALESVAFPLLICLHGIISLGIMVALLLLLNGALLGDEARMSLLRFWKAAELQLVAQSLILLGELAGVIVLWLCVVVSTAFLGYCLRLHASSEHIIRTTGIFICPIRIYVRFDQIN